MLKISELATTSRNQKNTTKLNPKKIEQNKMKFMNRKYTLDRTERLKMVSSKRIIKLINP